VRTAGAFGVRVPAGAEVDFTAAMDRMRRVRAEISRHDAVADFSRTYGVDVFLGDARFSSVDAVDVDVTALRFARAVIATGARPAVPEIPGLADGPYFTNETVFNLTERPAHLAVLGGGPIGCELAQAFARLGSRVTLIERGPRLLGREDADAADLLERVLRREGVELLVGTTVERVEQRDGAARSLLCRSSDDKTMRVDADAVLVAVGRTPNVERLNLEAAGVAYDRHGVTVDDRLRTSNHRVFAAGDVCLPRQQFTHAADASARVAAQNALLLPLKRWSRQVVPWVTYTDPEIARVGLSESEAAAEGVAVRVHSRAARRRRPCHDRRRNRRLREDPDPRPR
jgi:pyruvate/2-oxoglutarate dehydrogenase complex dihydrolipoamide dehydrogenase (E3) component